MRKKQNSNFNENFIEYNGFRGPVKIWEINYPKDIKFEEEYLSKEYPSELYYG